MGRPIPPELDNPRNREVLEYLEPLSCHGDNAEPLYRHLADKAGVESFCPEPRDYRYMLWFVDHTVFAYAVGMRGVGLRLPAGHALAKSEGRFSAEFDGASWYDFAYDCDRLAELADLALANARQ